MGLNYSVILCSTLILFFIQDFVKCDRHWNVDFGVTVDHHNNQKKSNVNNPKIQLDSTHKPHHHNHDVHHSDLESEEYDGGHKKGRKEWAHNQYIKHLKEWGKFGDEEHHGTEKHGDKHWKKHDLDKQGNKWGHSHSDNVKDDKAEWKDKENWSKEKGNGYVKKWSWEKESGERDAFGKKASHADHHHKKSHGDKHAFNKYQDQNAKKYSYKDYNSGKNWKKYGKKNADSGKKSHGYKSWEEKKPEYLEYQKILKRSSYRKEPGLNNNSQQY